MAVINDVLNDINKFKILLSALPKNWDGKSCIKEMYDAGDKNWKQTEWIGFYAEYKIRKLLNSQLDIKLIGDKVGRVEFDLKGNINWDIKSHPNSTPSAILNDCIATNWSIEEYKLHGLVMICLDCTFDLDGSFKFWHDELKGNTSKYELERVRRGARSRRRKISAMITSIEFAVIDSSSVTLLGKRQEGWRNSDGGLRKAKYSINNSQIESMSKGKILFK